jgi:hypothetical protein
MAIRIKSRGPEIVISLAALGFLTLAGMCIYIRGCGGGEGVPLCASQLSVRTLEIAKSRKMEIRPVAASREISGGVAASRN